MFRQYRFGVELHTMDWQRAMSETHDYTVAASGGDAQTLGQACFVNAQ